MKNEFIIVLTMAAIAVMLGLWMGFKLLEEMNEPKEALYICCPHSAMRLEEEVENAEA